MDDVYYSRYNLSELYEALGSIDRNKYPENYLKLTEEINRKKLLAPPEKSKASGFFLRKIDPSSYVICAAFYLISILEYSQGFIYASSRTQKGLYLRGTNATLAFVGINFLVVGSLLYWLIQAKNLDSNSLFRNAFWLTMGFGMLLFGAGIIRQLF